MGRKGTESPQNKHIDKNQRAGKELQGGVRLSREGGDKGFRGAATERDADNQAEVVTSLGIFCQVALDADDTKEFASFFHCGTGKYSAV